VLIIFNSFNKKDDDITIIDEVTDVDNSNKKINVIKTSAIVVLTIVILFFIFPRLGTSLLMLLKKFMFLLPMLLNFLPI
jgi:hypothetical protein